MFLKAESADSKKYNPNWWESMCSPFANDYCKAACKEFETLEKIVTWDIIDHNPYIHVLELTWAFKFKRFHSVLINKLNSILCVWGDQQLEGVDYFKTYVPVVQ